MTRATQSSAERIRDKRSRSNPRRRVGHLRAVRHASPAARSRVQTNARLQPERSRPTVSSKFDFPSRRADRTWSDIGYGVCSESAFKDVLDTAAELDPAWSVDILEEVRLEEEC